MAKNNLKAILIKEGITQAELARKSNVSHGTINRLCNHNRDVSPTIKSRILKGLKPLADIEYKLVDIFPE